MRAFDVVVVPDFSGRARITFEARMLYFLASWIEYSEVNGAFPLHLACIGEPPPSVKKLADRCGAIISIHEPASAELGVYANKLRGFEVEAQTDHILLLDVDIVILGSLAELATSTPDDAICAAPSHSGIILPEMWAELYTRLDVPAPTGRMPDFHRTLDMDSAAAANLYPSFNSGVVLAPRASELPTIWLDHLRVVGELRPGWNEQLKSLNMAATDEPALATAVEYLRHRGAKVVSLPDRYNGRWRHLYRRSPRLSELTIFHMTSSFAYGESLSEKLDPSAHGYQKKLLRRFGKRWLQHSGSYASEAVRYLLPATIELRKLRPVLEKLYRKHIVPTVGADLR